MAHTLQSIEFNWILWVFFLNQFKAKSWQRSIQKLWQRIPCLCLLANDLHFPLFPKYAIVHYIIKIFFKLNFTFLCIFRIDINWLIIYPIIELASNFCNEWYTFPCWKFFGNICLSLKLEVLCVRDEDLLH